MTSNAAVSVGSGTHSALRFDQTVVRELVHKWSLTEVFLTDHAVLDDSSFLSSAQLPFSHGYYNDHGGTVSGVVDPLLILEVARQIATYGAYAHVGVPSSAVLVLSDYCLDLAEPMTVEGTDRPAELVGTTSVTERRARARRPASLAYKTELSRSGRRIATVAMTVTWLAADQYRALRRMTRGGEPPTAFDTELPVDGTPVDPERVNRFDPANVAIRGVTVDSGGASALLEPRCYRNRSMFDHPYDHVPAMVLTEASRQLLLVAADADNSRFRRIRGEFTAFAEIDGPVEVSVAPPYGAADVDVSLTQAGRSVAAIAVTVT